MVEACWISSAVWEGLRFLCLFCLTSLGSSTINGGVCWSTDSSLEFRIGWSMACWFSMDWLCSISFRSCCIEAGKSSLLSYLAWLSKVFWMCALCLWSVWSKTVCMVRYSAWHDCTMAIEFISCLHCVFSYIICSFDFINNLTSFSVFFCILFWSATLDSISSCTCWIPSCTKSRSFLSPPRYF